ncbi:MAG: type II toxin-antitoxin system RelE/ParE family toxin [Calditrichaceae bacterium]|nr:type II toxin-antitoxin system RelE/ParE family toxin [Calditrichaceae bacterium]MBN2708945.1 type II toxin-antitoxin system RelE/ParE family toxin [Calditrichaceae bacterium]RQV97532.1 MAG: type II toxin-antitoxin system RelE/ParE family toxin [Calditrichota bacterium]
MGKIIWSPTASEDLDLIALYISRDSVDRAALFITKVIHQVEKLHDFPGTGRVIPEMSDENCRELIYGNYRIMYRIMPNKDIRITGVIHGARNWQPE